MRVDTKALPLIRTLACVSVRYTAYSQSSMHGRATLSRQH
jgi:hypothetical protein